MSLANLPKQERPRERLLLHGAHSLSLSELLAIIIGQGTRGRNAVDLARELLSDFGGLHNLVNASVSELSKTKGIGEAKALQMKAVLELASRLSLQRSPYPIAVKNFADIAQVLRPYIQGLQQEQLFVICLNVKGAITHIEIVTRGILSAVLIHPREVFAVAVGHRAAQIVLAHNHPSGDATPSAKDISVTDDLIKAGLLLKIPVAEHLVLSQTRFSLIRKGESNIPYTSPHAF